MLWLFKHRPAKLRISVISEINTLIHKPPAMGVQHHPQKIAYLAIIFSLFGRHVQITKIFHMQIHRRCMTAIKFAISLRAQPKGHIQPLAGIMRRTAHFCMCPISTKFSLSQCIASFKSATGKNDRISRYCFITNHDTTDPAIRSHQTCHTGIKPYLATQFFKGSSFHIIQPDTFILGSKC